MSIFAGQGGVVQEFSYRREKEKPNTGSTYTEELRELRFVNFTYHFGFNTPWKGIKFENNNQSARRGFPAGHPLERTDREFYKEGKGIPYPIRVIRHLGSSDCHQSANEISGLTKMNWNNDGLYDRLPVSISYASVLARVIKRMGSLLRTPYSFRYFI